MQHTSPEGRSKLPEILSAAGPLPACHGGAVVVQDPGEAIASSMPASALKHVPTVDHCCGVVGIAALLETYANDAPPTVSLFETRALLEAEDRIAEGAFAPADWQLLIRSGRFTGLSCPECGSALCELPTAGMLRFRCHSGHAWSAHSLMSAQAEVRDSNQSRLYSAMMDEVMLSERILSEPSYRQEIEFSDDVRRRIVQRMLEAHQIRKWSSANLEGSGIESPITPPAAAVT